MSVHWVNGTHRPLKENTDAPRPSSLRGRLITPAARYGLGMLPAISTFSSLDQSEKSKALGLLFEPCPTLVDLVLPLTNHKYNSWTELIERVRQELHKLKPADPRVSGIIAAHPRLGAKKVDSAQSQAEQKSLGSQSESEAQLLLDANNKYEETFPGLRYVVFVAGRPRSEILKNMHSRIGEGKYDLEVARAFDAMCDIAIDRQAKAGKL